MIGFMHSSKPSLIYASRRRWTVSKTGCGLPYLGEMRGYCSLIPLPETYFFPSCHAASKSLFAASLISSGSNFIYSTPIYESTHHHLINKYKRNHGFSDRDYPGRDRGIMTSLYFYFSIFHNSQVNRMLLF